MSKKRNTLTVLTLNAGLLDVRFFGIPIIQPAPFVKERLSCLPSALVRINSDVIALQEVFDQKHRLFLIGKLRKHYPYHFYSRQRRVFRLEDSLIFFSKYPIIQKSALRFKNNILEEALFTYKGVLTAKIKIPSWGGASFFNFHTVAGGLRDPQSKQVEIVRGIQISQMLKKIQRGGERGMKIVLGDLNAGPESSKSNYEIFKKYNFIDAIAYKHKRNFSKITWDPTNKLNIKGPHKNSPPQRCDHIFLRKNDFKSVRIERVDIILDRPIVKIGGRFKVTVSDHAGVLLRISRI